MTTASSEAVRGQDRMIRLTQVNHCQRRYYKQAKGTQTPEPKGTRPGLSNTLFLSADEEPPA